LQHAPYYIYKVKIFICFFTSSLSFSIFAANQHPPSLVGQNVVLRIQDGSRQVLQAVFLEIVKDGDKTPLLQFVMALYRTPLSKKS